LVPSTTTSALRTNSPNRGYVNEPGLLRINFYYGAVWTLGLRGRF